MPHNHTKASTIVFSKRYPFADWPNREIPLVAAGVYAIWHNDTLIYCGMSGRKISKAQTAGKTRYGLTTRLASHASGRLSGDQFCVYVANRIRALKGSDAKYTDSAYVSAANKETNV